MRLLKSVGGGVLIMVAISASWVIAAALTDHMASDPWPVRALFWALAWPLDVFQSVFPADPAALSPDTPTLTAVLATLALDLIVYSIVAYGSGAMFGRVRRGRRPALSERRI
jgi:hypothetical protein